MKVLAESPGVLAEMRRDLTVKFEMTSQMTEAEMIEDLKNQGKLYA